MAIAASSHSAWRRPCRLQQPSTRAYLRMSWPELEKLIASLLDLQGDCCVLTGSVGGLPLHNCLAIWRCVKVSLYVLGVRTINP